jgi:glycosyltransferase involved in cell wall biosynthesis
MSHTLPNVVAIGLAKRALVVGTRERTRMVEYGTILGSYELIVLTRKHEKYPSLQTEGNTRLYATNTKTRFGMLLQAYRTAVQIITRDPEKQWIISAQDPHIIGFVAWLVALRTKASLQVQVHGDVFHPRFFSSIYIRAIYNTLGTYVLKRAKNIRVVSQRIHDSLTARGVLSKRITILPIEADLAVFLQSGASRQYSNTTEPVFLYSGRLAPEKNLPLLIDAFALACSKGMLGKLWIVGEGPMRTQLHDLVQEKMLTTVSFYPWSDTIETMYSQADVFCLTSHHEGYAMVLQEAMAAGLPLITTDVGCVGEIVTTEEAIIASPSTVKAYADALISLSRDPELRRRLGVNGYTKIKKTTRTHKDYLQAVQQSFMFLS